eukprot:s5_g49.t1
MPPRPGPENELPDLREEVGDLRAEVRRLRREFSDPRRFVVGESDGRASDSRIRESNRARTAGCQRSSHSPERDRALPTAPTPPSGSQSAPVTAAPAVQSLPVTAASAVQSVPVPTLNRGVSGREKINLPSRPNNHEYECRDSVFVGLPSEREAKRVVYSAELLWPGGRDMSTFSQPAAPADASPCVFAEGIVAAEYPDQQRDYLEALQEFNLDYWFDPDPHRQAVPCAHALVHVAQEHFAFFSAAETPDEVDAEQDMEDLANGAEDPGLDGEPLEFCGGVRVTVGDHDEKLTKQLDRSSPNPLVPKRKAAAKVVSAKHAACVNKDSLFSQPNVEELKRLYPMLDLRLVNAAPQSGIPRSKPADMQKLLGAAPPKIGKMKDLNPAIKPRHDPLALQGVALVADQAT